MSFPSRGAIYWPVERDGYDWPKGTSEAVRVWLVSEVTAILRNHGPRALYEIVALVSADAMGSDHPAAKDFREGVLLDWRYAAVERALRAVDAECRYSLWKVEASGKLFRFQYRLKQGRGWTDWLWDGTETGFDAAEQRAVALLAKPGVKARVRVVEVLREERVAWER